MRLLKNPYPASGTVLDFVVRMGIGVFFAAPRYDGLFPADTPVRCSTYCIMPQRFIRATRRS
ncbi:hypothetical protein [Burkholderia territorii]|nr:hypothetical protein [Burkholderia territorii]